MLKEILGEELYNQVQEKLGDKKVDVVNSGQWIPKEKFDKVINEKNNLKKQLEEIDTDAIDKQKQEVWNLQKELILEKQGLGEFKDFFNVDNVEDLNTKIESFKGILGEKFKENQLNTNYTPENHKPTDAYAEAKKNKDVGGMIGHKLSNIFK